MSDFRPERPVKHGPAERVGPPADVPPGASEWVPPPPGWSPSLPPGWGAPTGSAYAGRGFLFDRARLLPTALVAVVIAAVVLGGIGLDAAIAAPSAGTVTVGGSVTITAAPGWVVASSPGDTSGGIELQKSDAILTAQVVSSSYSGDSASMLADQEQSLSGDSAQVSYGDTHSTSISGHDTTYVVFEAAVASGKGPGVVDGELICMVLEGNAVVILVGAHQGDLDSVIDDVSAMLVSVAVGR